MKNEHDPFDELLEAMLTKPGPGSSEQEPEHPADVKDGEED